MTDLDLTFEVISVENICDRFEQLEEQMPDGDDARNWEDAAEFKQLSDILEELKGAGGDHRWRGDWYPSHLIRETYFTDYVEEMLRDCGTIPKDLPAWVHIDWESTAHEVKTDYIGIEIDGSTYWFR